jgi:hypothetical protein
MALVHERTIPTKVVVALNKILSLYFAEGTGKNHKISGSIASNAKLLPMTSVYITMLHLMNAWF